MKKIIALTFFASLLILGVSSSVSAQKSNLRKLTFNASRTFVEDPLGTGAAFAQWLNGIGETDSNCQTNFGLLLQKNAPTSVYVSANAELKGLKGTVVMAGDTFGYDIRNGTSGFSFVGGCANGTITQSPQNPSWRRVTFNLQTQAFPALPVGSTLGMVVLIVDDPGTYNLDNIMFRGMYIDKPGNAGSAPMCSF